MKITKYVKSDHHICLTTCQHIMTSQKHKKLVSSSWYTEHLGLHSNYTPTVFIFGLLITYRLALEMFVMATIVEIPFKHQILTFKYSYQYNNKINQILWTAKLSLFPNSLWTATKPYTKHLESNSLLTHMWILPLQLSSLINLLVNILIIVLVRWLNYYNCWWLIPFIKWCVGLTCSVVKYSFSVWWSKYWTRLGA
jgi:hypothetical protein